MGNPYFRADFQYIYFDFLVFVHMFRNKRLDPKILKSIFSSISIKIDKRLIFHKDLKTKDIVNKFLEEAAAKHRVFFDELGETVSKEEANKKVLDYIGLKTKEIHDSVYAYYIAKDEAADQLNTNLVDLTEHNSRNKIKRVNIALDKVFSSMFSEIWWEFGKTNLDKVFRKSIEIVIKSNFHMNLPLTFKGFLKILIFSPFLGYLAYYIVSFISFLTGDGWFSSDAMTFVELSAMNWFLGLFFILVSRAVFSSGYMKSLSLDTRSLKSIMDVYSPQGDDKIECKHCRFTSFDKSPVEEKLLGEKWQYSNKDGSRDKRRKDNILVKVFENTFLCKTCDKTTTLKVTTEIEGEAI